MHRQHFIRHTKAFVTRKYYGRSYQRWVDLDTDALTYTYVLHANHIWEFVSTYFLRQCTTNFIRFSYSSRSLNTVRFGLRLLAESYFRFSLMRRLMCGMHAAFCVPEQPLFDMSTIPISAVPHCCLYFAELGSIWIIITINFNKLFAFIYLSGVCIQTHRWMRCLCASTASAIIALYSPSGWFGV